MPTNNIQNVPQILLSEAIESLTFGLKYYDEYCISEEIGVIKQSITNFHRFLECTLKYFIARINPLLVFTKSFEKSINIENDHIITFDQALTFYINNLEYGLLSTPSGYKHTKEKFKFKLSRLKKLRNKITHWFIHPDEVKDVHEQLSEAIELAYFIYLEENISDAIHKRLSPDALETLNTLIDTQKANLDKAYREVENYIASRTSLDPKEQHDGEAPVFECPDCRKETLILEEPDETIFKCTFCKNTEEASECSLSLICFPLKTPKCYLQSWNEEDGSMICEDCEDHINYKASKD